MSLYYIWTIGCQMNKADSEQISASLEEAGFQATTTAQDANIIVLNSCVVRGSAEQKVSDKLDSLKFLKQGHLKPSIILTGCMVSSNIEQLEERFPHVDLFLKPQDMKSWHRWLQSKNINLPQCGTPLIPARPPLTTYVPIIKGCNNFCSYCIVPYRRGKEISHPIDEIREQVESLVKRGTKEVTLLGQNVDSYGHDLPSKPDLADLLSNLNDISGLERIRFLTSHPKDMSLKLIETTARLDKVCECISLAVQSGDNDILKAMRRGYTVEQYRLLVEQIRSAIPKVAISTDVIVGFPGETAAQFQNTVSLLSELRFDIVHVAAYSVRPGTRAAKFNDNVPQEEKARRLHLIEAMQESIASEINAQLLGEIEEILVEGKRKDRWYGRSRTDKLVFFNSDTCYTGQMVSIKITSAGSWSLRGNECDTCCTSAI
ncbi:MAG: tRNA (N6-isopentenyl adenosine(37)-C2)-methylthiotransferase MiaB [Dehalococcoidia bacterium]|nr:tRNA (N6-isopentenyl adenosine(37)-C2)-methylthiotransferase MiaB [Dehalococcoidia bacterium]